MPRDLSTLLLLLTVAVVILLLVATAVQHRRHSAQTDQKLCRGCGTAHPAFAQFCRRCGRRL
jgi:ribosomal protein L40E